MTDETPRSDGLDEPPADGLETCRIVITRRISADGDDLVWVNDNPEHSLVELLGMLELAKDSLIRLRLGEAP